MNLVYAQFARGDEISTLVQSEFFAYALPFLFAFAVVYGLLSNAGKKGMPEDKHARIVIALATGFLVLPSAPALIGVLTTISGGLLVAVGAFLTLVILFEVVGLKKGKEGGITPIQEHRRIFVAIVGLILALIFINAGGFTALGLPSPQFLLNSPLVFFLVFIIIIVWWIGARE